MINPSDINFQQEQIEFYSDKCQCGNYLNELGKCEYPESALCVL